MSLVRIRDTEEVIFKSEFEDRLRRSNVGIPSEGLNPEALDHHGADPVMEGAQPTGAAWQCAQRDGVEQVNGHWFAKYVLVPTFATQEEHDAYDAQWQAAQLKAQTPEVISDRQFFHALWKAGKITLAEARAAVQTGQMPADIEAFFLLLGEDEQNPEVAGDERMLIEGATTFNRSHPMTSMFGAMYGMSDLQIDALWRLAGAL